jgi:tetratricopeptide (TPR) repeat protein
VFGFGKKAKVLKAVERAMADVELDEDRADHAPLDALPEDLQATAYLTLAHELFDNEHYAAAKDTITRALAKRPDDVGFHELAAQIYKELGEWQAAIRSQRLVVEHEPEQTAPAMLLAELLIKSAKLAEAIVILQRFHDVDDPEVSTRLAEAKFLHGDTQQAFELLDQVCKRYEAMLKEPWSGPDRQGLIARAGHADRLRQDVYAELHGREATIELSAKAGRLNARAGVNYRLLGARLAASTDYVSEVLDLQDPDATEQRGRALGKASAWGHALVGSAQLRRGDLRAADESFERASELDGTCFAAFFGKGAVLDYDKHDMHRRAERMFPAARVTPELARVFPDWEALTELERRVVWGGVAPWANMLPTLAGRGVVMRILPIDVLATDSTLLEDVAGKRAAYDHRSYDAISGVATERGAIAKIEELLDVLSDNSWTFAHEFAHLVYFHLDEARAKPFEQLYARAKKAKYATTSYALKNDDELFAVSYTDYLRHLYELPDTPLEDDAGVQRALMSYFDELCVRPR